MLVFPENFVYVPNEWPLWKKSISIKFLGGIFRTLSSIFDGDLMEPYPQNSSIAYTWQTAKYASVSADEIFPCTILDRFYYLCLEYQRQISSILRNNCPKNFLDISKYLFFFSTLCLTSIYNIYNIRSFEIVKN